MVHKTIEDISKRMAEIDIAILSTHTQNGQIANRPMSNNGDVAYDGTSYYSLLNGSLDTPNISHGRRRSGPRRSEGRRMMVVKKHGVIIETPTEARQG